MRQEWFQVEFLSKIDGAWIPLYPRHTTIEGARVDRDKIKLYEAHIVHIQQIREVVQ